MSIPKFVKCPKCRSDDLTRPNGFMPLIFTMKPITCNACRSKLELRLVIRIGFLLFVSLTAAYLSTYQLLIDKLGADLFATLFFTYLGLSVIVAVIVGVTEVFHSWQLTLWSSKDTIRAVVNYGLMISLLFLAFFFFKLIYLHAISPTLTQ